MSVMQTALADAPWTQAGPGVELAPLTGDPKLTAFMRFQPGATAPPHRHPGGEHLYVISGRLRVGDRHLVEGDFLHTPPGGVHDAEADGGEEAVVLISVPEPVEFL